MVSRADFTKNKRSAGKGKHNNNRQTFEEMLEQCRIQSAHRLWQKARRASQLRHLTIQRGGDKSAALLSSVKNRSVYKVIELAPEKVRFDIDDTYHVGLMNVSWSGDGRLHLPYQYLVNKKFKKTMPAVILTDGSFIHDNRRSKCHR